MEKPTKINGRWVCIEHINLNGRFDNDIQPSLRPLKPVIIKVEHDCKECDDRNNGLYVPPPPKPPPPPPRKHKVVNISIFFIKGANFFSNSGYEIIKSVHDHLESKIGNHINSKTGKRYFRNARLKFEIFDENPGGREEVQKAIKRYASSSSSYVMLMGYSYGGDAAFIVASSKVLNSSFKYSGNRYANMLNDLWLLDPVGPLSPSSQFKVVRSIMGKDHFRVKMMRRLHEHDKVGWNGSDHAAYAGQWWSYHNPRWEALIKKAGFTYTHGFGRNDLFTHPPTESNPSGPFHHNDLEAMMHHYGFMDLALNKCIKFYKDNSSDPDR